MRGGLRGIVLWFGIVSKFVYIDYWSPRCAILGVSDGTRQWVLMHSASFVTFLEYDPALAIISMRYTGRRETYLRGRRCERE